jgi:hypothetical protein
MSQAAVLSVAQMPQRDVRDVKAFSTVDANVKLKIGLNINKFAIKWKLQIKN